MITLKEMQDRIANTHAALVRPTGDAERADWEYRIWYGEPAKVKP